MNQRITHLINNELDGLNSAEDRNELMSILDNNPEAKLLFDDLSQLNDKFSLLKCSVPTIEIVDSVRQEINKLDTQATVDKHSPKNTKITEYTMTSKFSLGKISLTTSFF